MRECQSGKRFLAWGRWGLKGSPEPWPTLPAGEYDVLDEAARGDRPG